MDSISSRATSQATNASFPSMAHDVARRPSHHSHLYQLTRNIRELALVQLRIPEDRVRIAEAMLHPTILLYVVQVDETTRVRITMCRSQDTPSTELECLVVAEIIAVLCVEHAVCEGLTGADAEEVAGEARAVAVDVIEGGALLRGYAGAHCTLKMLSAHEWYCEEEGRTYHAQAHALVRVHQVRQDLGRCGDGDAALVSELVEATLHSKVCEPVLAVLSHINTNVLDTSMQYVSQQRHQPWSPASSC
jgi:hypothetical protein